jgi:YHS domain-containing protein
VQGLLSLLLFAAFFYFMMRFGCGAHMVHGSHGGREGHGAPVGSATDPVCGMEVPVGQGYAKMHEDRQYRFCSRQCLDQFELEPQRYTKGVAR